MKIMKIEPQAMYEISGKELLEIVDQVFKLTLHEGEILGAQKVLGIICEIQDWKAFEAFKKQYKGYKILFDDLKGRNN